MRISKRLSIAFVLLATTLLSGSCTVKEKEEYSQNILGKESLISKEAPTLRADEIAKMAREITVLIEGPSSSGSGVIIQKDGSQYLLATAWHVIRSAQQGEELTAKTNDGKSHKLDARDAIKIKDVDLAIIKFTSRNTYKSAAIGRSLNAETSDKVYVSGYPLATEAVPNQLLRTFDGKVIANTNKFIPNGYQLLYTNTTLPGMSGGPVLDEKGGLAGIHGQAELDILLTQNEDIAVKTGTNQAIPSSYLLIKGNKEGKRKIASKDSLANFYILRAINIRKQIIANYNDLTSQEKRCLMPYPGTRVIQALAMDAIYNLDKAIETKPTSYAYYLRALYKANRSGLRSGWTFNRKFFGPVRIYKSTIEEDLNEALKLHKKNTAALSMLASMAPIKGSWVDRERELYKKLFPEMNDQALVDAMKLDDYGAKLTEWRKIKVKSKELDELFRKSNPQFELFERAIEINPYRVDTYSEYAKMLNRVRRYSWRLDIINKGIKYNPNSSELYWLKSGALSDLDFSNEDKIKAIDQAIKIDPTKSRYHAQKAHLHNFNNEYQKSIKSYRMAIATGGSEYIRRQIAEIYKYRLHDEEKYLEVMQELRYLPSFLEKQSDSPIVDRSFCSKMVTRMLSKDQFEF